MQYALVTGACGGIGSVFVKKLYEQGENLILIGRSLEKLQTLKQTIFNENKGSILCFELDLSNENEVLNLFSELERSKIVLNGLYYIAGVDTQKAFISYEYKKIILQARVVFESALLFTNFALKNRGDKLKILIMSSACGFVPMPYFSEYSSLKGALISFYRALKCEVDKKTTKITVVTPSSVPTRDDIKKDILKQGFSAKLLKKSPEYVVRKSLKALNKNKTICVPGFFNKVVTYGGQLLPKAVKTKIVKKKFKNKQKDAF